MVKHKHSRKHDLKQQRNADVIQRIAYLKQVNALLTTSSAADTDTDAISSSSSHNRSNKKKQNHSSKHSTSTLPATHFYNHTLLSLSRRTVQRLSGALKSSICERCMTTLIPSITCDDTVSIDVY